MNRVAALTVPTVLAFVSGAFLAAGRGGNALHDAKQQVAPSSTGQTQSKALRITDRRTDEECFGHLVSALAEKSHLKRRHDLYEAVSVLSAAELPKMITRAQALPKQNREQVTAALLTHWFELDPQAARTWLHSQRNSNVYYYWSTLADEFPDIVLAELRANPKLKRASWILEQVVVAQAGPEQREQAVKLATLPADSLRDQVLGKILSEWAKTDAARAFAFAHDLPVGALRRSATETALLEWAKTDPRRVTKELTLILPELESGLTGNRLLGVVAEQLSKNDPQAALDWLATLPAAHRSHSLYVVAATGWAKTDPLAALAWCRENAIDPGRDSLIGGAWGKSVVSVAMETRPSDTLQWIQSLPAGDERNRLLENALSTESSLVSPPVSAENAQLVVRLLQQLTPAAQERAAYRLGWTSNHKRNLEDLRQWTERLADDRLRGAAIEAVASYRATGPAENVQKLLDAFPDGIEHDAVLRGLAAGTRQVRPEEAAKRAMEIRDPIARREAVEDTIVDWLERKPADARAWLKASDVVPREWSAQWLTEAAP